MTEYSKTLHHPYLRSVVARSLDDEAELKRQGYAPAKVPEYCEFPKTLTHPEYAPARMVSAEKHGRPAGSACPSSIAATGLLASYEPAEWEPERYPPVTANSTEEEAKFVALGYRVDGAPDATAFAAAHASPGTPRSEPILFPMWIAPPDGEPLIVKSEAEETALRARWAAERKKGDAKPGQGARA
jgi:hypothetical protein